MDRPILFSGPMVLAILEGRKTQTRRVLKDKLVEPFETLPSELQESNEIAGWSWDDKKMFLTPYRVGDRLYVREAWRVLQVLDQFSPKQLAEGGGKIGIGFEADGNHGFKGRFRQGMHLPKVFSRIWLRVTNVRVQRVTEICACDAEAEGIETSEMLHARTDLYPAEKRLAQKMQMKQPVPQFKRLWDSLNATRDYGWSDNPWVSAYTFERIDKPETGGN